LNLVGLVDAEYANTLYSVTRRIEDLAGLSRRDATGTVREDDSYVTRANLGSERSVIGARHAAKLNLCEHRRSA
jgi:hypothetical protein